MNVIIPEPLHGLTEKDYRHVVDIIENLKRPAGILSMKMILTKVGTTGLRILTPKRKLLKFRLIPLQPITLYSVLALSCQIPKRSGFLMKLSWIRIELSKMSKDPAQIRIDKKSPLTTHLKRLWDRSQVKSNKCRRKNRSRDARSRINQYGCIRRKTLLFSISYYSANFKAKAGPENSYREKFRIDYVIIA